MTDRLKTLAAIIDVATTRNITGNQAIALLSEIREMLNDWEFQDELEAEARAAQERDAAFLRALGPREW